MHSQNKRPLQVLFLMEVMWGCSAGYKTFMDQNRHEVYNHDSFGLGMWVAESCL